MLRKMMISSILLVLRKALGTLLWGHMMWSWELPIFFLIFQIYFGAHETAWAVVQETVSILSMAQCVSFEGRAKWTLVVCVPDGWMCAASQKKNMLRLRKSWKRIKDRDISGPFFFVCVTKDSLAPLIILFHDGVMKAFQTLFHFLWIRERLSEAERNQEPPPRISCIPKKTILAFWALVTQPLMWCAVHTHPRNQA